MSSGADCSANASLIAAAATSAAGVRSELKKFTPSLAKDFKIADEAAAEAVEATAEMVERAGAPKTTIAHNSQETLSGGKNPMPRRCVTKATSKNYLRKKISCLPLGARFRLSLLSGGGGNR